MKKELGIFLLLFGLCVFMSIRDPNFLSAYNLQNMGQRIGMYGIFSIGVGIVIITGGIDLSVGSVFALLGVLLAIMLSEYHWHWLIAVPIVMLVAIGLGCAHGFLITKVRLQPFIVTLCGLLLYRGVARYIAGDMSKGFGTATYGILRNITVRPLIIQFPFTVPLAIAIPIVLALVWLLIPRPIYGRYAFFLGGRREASTESGKRPLWRLVVALAVSVIVTIVVTVFMIVTWPGGIRRFPPMPMPFLILIVITVLMWFLIHRSVYGRYIFAVGRNEDAARYSGINSQLVIASAYVLCMILTAISGIILSLDTNSISASDFGVAYELYGIAAAVLGGCSLRGGEGSIIGIVIGTALLRVLENIVNLMGIPSSLNFAVMGGVILIGVLVDELLKQRSRAQSRQRGFAVITPQPPQPVEKA